MSTPTTAQKFGAEVIGTAILVFIGAGSVPLTVFLTGSNPFGSAELSTISFAFAFAIFAAVYSVGHISGAHINPAVTIALLATRKIDTRTAGYYVAAQLVGATLGAVLTYIILIGNDPVKLGLGAVAVNANAGPYVGLLAEIIGTAILVFTVFGSAVDGRAPAGFAGIVIGFIVYGIIILVGPITGAALNPAREFGPNLVQTLIGGTAKWGEFWVYVLGPIGGGLLGAFTYEAIGRKPVPAVQRTVAPVAERAAAERA
jgi:glycerol uptake facilitator protein